MTYLGWNSSNILDRRWLCIYCYLCSKKFNLTILLNNSTSNISRCNSVLNDLTTSNNQNTFWRYLVRYWRIINYSTIHAICCYITVCDNSISFQYIEKSSWIFTLQLSVYLCFLYSNLCIIASVNTNNRRNFRYSIILC